ncbi:MAG: J domain-containing protein [Okeania sp. SIO2D1]|uniref:J domain-containing protein n=1 Tax=Okeania sp. SIO2C9 TaxID=2607791 RepID=UPI0013B8AEDC|nr:J domain-containing protein [Okeania sp. SIO2C9]NEQ73959.1 J domain-containing protein [Okeania sp. SIO2C9]NES68676.1 J domain-containing protein [Okeania sp. SIO2D1]
MVTGDYYKTLNVNPTATQGQIKQAYRRLVKLFHPDANTETGDHERIISINEAYEVLGDPQLRKSYDRQFNQHDQKYTNTKQSYYKQNKRGNNADENLQKWLNQVYKPVNKILIQILKPLKKEIDYLAADPFDDQLMESFQDYLETCRRLLKKAHNLFSSQPNPSNFAGVAAHLYYCLNQVSDGIEDLELFTINYDDSYLHTGQELFRIASRLRQEAQAGIDGIL